MENAVVTKETYTKDDYLQEIKDFYAYVNAKAEKHGILKSKDEEEREKQEKADRLEKTSEIYLSAMKEIDKVCEKVEQIKANGYDLKFSTTSGNTYYDDMFIIKVSSDNPDDLPTEEISNIINMIDKFISYHNQYNRLKEIYNNHWLAANPYFMGVFEYVAAKECCRGSSYIRIEDVKRLMLMSGIFMWEAGLSCAEGSEVETNV